MQNSFGGYFFGAPDIGKIHCAPAGFFLARTFGSDSTGWVGQISIFSHSFAVLRCSKRGIWKTDVFDTADRTDELVGHCSCCFLLLRPGTAGDVDKHEEDGDSGEAARGAAAGQRGGQHSQTYGRVRRPTARVPRGIPQDRSVAVLVQHSVRKYRRGNSVPSCLRFVDYSVI